MREVKMVVGSLRPCKANGMFGCEFRVDLQRRSLFGGGLVQTLLNMAKNYCFGFSADMYYYSAMSQGFREFLLLLRIGSQTAASLCRRLITQAEYMMQYFMGKRES